MKSIILGMLIAFFVLAPLLFAAGSDADRTAEQPSIWRRFWQGVADDWKSIGQEAKRSGIEAGQTAKEEFKKMPENFRNGVEEAKKDFKTGTSSPGESHPEN